MANEIVSPGLHQPFGVILAKAQNSPEFCCRIMHGGFEKQKSENIPLN